MSNPHIARYPKRLGESKYPISSLNPAVLLAMRNKSMAPSFPALRINSVEMFLANASISSSLPRYCLDFLIPGSSDLVL